MTRSCTPPPPTCEWITLEHLLLPNPQCVVLSGGQDSECGQVAQAFDSPEGSLASQLYDGEEDRLTNDFRWTQSALFAFVVDANECAGQPKAVRVAKNVVAGQPVPFPSSDIDGNSVTYCTCK